MTKPHQYTAEMGGVHDTRHEAVGAAAIAAREWPIGGPESVIEVTQRVYAQDPHICGYCRETFLHWGEYKSHHPCPHWEAEGAMLEAED